MSMIGTTGPARIDRLSVGVTLDLTGATVTGGTFTPSSISTSSVTTTILVLNGDSSGIDNASGDHSNGYWIGRRGGNMGIVAPSTGSVARSFEVYTSNDTSAGIGNISPRMVVTGGASTAQVQITNADLSMGANDIDFAAGGRMNFADSQSTVGAAGGASALPATPTGYILIEVAGTTRVVPFYAQA